MQKQIVIQILRSYSKHPKQLAKDLNNLGTKFKMTQKVQDKLNTQRFLETQLKDGKLIESIERTQKSDKQFSEFLKDYRGKHKDIANIIDVSHYNRQNNPFNKNEEERKQELEMLQEFRRRQQMRGESERRGEAMLNSLGYSQKGEEEEDSDQDFPSLKETENKEEQKQEERQENDNDMIFKDTVREEVSDLYEKDMFEMLILDQGSTTLITKLNRINHFRAFVFMGNYQGVIGYGYGKGNDMEDAMEYAIRNCKKNLIAIPLDDQLTWLQNINTNYNGFQMRIFCRPKMGWNPWGSPLIGCMLSLAGIRDVSFKVIAGTIDPYAMTYAFFKAMTKNQTPQQWCEKIGTKIYHENFGKPYYVNPNNPNRAKHFQ